MELFSQIPMSDLPGTPLAEKLRPQSLADVLGQALVKKQIQEFLQKNFLPNLIFWGPPGCGKTSLALIIAKEFQAHVEIRNAVDTGAKQLREIGEAGKDRRRMHRERTIVFIDEIHRLNKGQQDVLLPFVEQGDLVLIGATTENPSYEINRALMSRCRLLTLQPVSEIELQSLYGRVFNHYNKLAKFNLTLEQFLTPEIQLALSQWASGDVRKIILCLEAIFESELWSEFAGTPLSWEQISEKLSHIVPYDKDGDQHYDLVSALIKSVRGSDAQAALYWLTAMIEGGEEPKFICRRLMILASEDIGNADPRALQLAVATTAAVENIGWPEGAICLSQLVTYLAMAPKSNRSYKALGLAKEYLKTHGLKPVPLALRSARTELMKQQGYGKNYEYSHNSQKGFIAQNFSPIGVELPNFYEPSDLGFEKTMKEYDKWRKG